MYMALKMQNTNSLLEGTESWLPDKKLRFKMGAAMDDFLAKRVSKEVAKDLSLEKWLEKVKDVDDNRRAEMERVIDALADAGRAAKRGTSGEDFDRNPKRPALSDPSRHYHTPNMSSSSHTAPSNRPSASTSSNHCSLPAAGSPAFVPLPCLTDAEKLILDRHSGCYKCRRVHVYHRSRKCRSGYPTAANYRPVTEADAPLHPATVRVGQLRLWSLQLPQTLSRTQLLLSSKAPCWKMTTIMIRRTR